MGVSEPESLIETTVQTPTNVMFKGVPGISTIAGSPHITNTTIPEQQSGTARTDMVKDSMVQQSGTVSNIGGIKQGVSVPKKKEVPLPYQTEESKQREINNNNIEIK